MFLEYTFQGQLLFRSEDKDADQISFFRYKHEGRVHTYAIYYGGVMELK